jgi:exosortase
VSRALTRELQIPWPAAAGGLLAFVAAAFAPSYAALAPLLTGDSPEVVLLLIPLGAFAMVIYDLRAARRYGHELGVNIALAAPFLLGLAMLLVILPGKLSYAYWLYRLDLLAVPFFVATAILLLFGFPALWASRRGLVFLILGWPPIVDTIVRATASPLADLQAKLVGLLVLPLDVVNVGPTFILPDGETLTISTACAGLVGVFAAGAVGGAVALFVTGSRRRRLGWVATAVALALLGNVVRLAIVVLAASVSGTGTLFSLLHGGAGVALFALTFGVSMLLLPRFGLRLDRPRQGRSEPVRMRGHGVLVTGLMLAGLAAVSTTLTAGTATLGLFEGVPRLNGPHLLALPAGWRLAASAPSPSLAASFGSGSRAQIVHAVGARGQRVGAQVIVTPSYARARSYGILQCFSFHRYSIRSSRYVPLDGGGTAALVSLQIGGEDVSSASWLQPVRVAGARAWRRVVFYEYADAAPEGATAAADRSLSLWLLNHLSPYGGVRADARFARAESDLIRLARGTALMSSS